VRESELRKMAIEESPFLEKMKYFLSSLIGILERMRQRNGSGSVESIFTTTNMVIIDKK
jgi:hypothetical protein